MIVASGDIHIPFPELTVIHGSTGNTVLPDPLLGQMDAGRPRALLNQYIGDDFQIPHNLKLKKVYDYAGDMLYEYTLFQVILANGQTGYTPISIKRYKGNTYTFLYTKGITLALDSIRGVRNYEILTATELLKMFTGDAITFTDKLLSIESPSQIEMILSELGSYALLDTMVSGYTIQTLFEDIVSHDPYQLFLYDNKLPTDNLSVFGYSNRFITDEWLLRHSDPTARLYEDLAIEQQKCVMHNTEPLDLRSPYYKEFQIDNILTEMLALPYTDCTIEVEESHITIVRFWILGQEQFVPEFHLYIPRYLHDGMLLHNQRNVEQIVKLEFTKTWLGDVYLVLHFQDGSLKMFYLNLGLYHLYSPSIIRLHPI